MKKALWKLLKSLVLFVLSLFLLSAAVFYVSRLAPGDPLVSYYGDRVEKMSPEQRAWAEAGWVWTSPFPPSMSAGWVRP